MHERTGNRDLLYSGWHRPRSISRFLGRRIAALVTVIDVDWCEYCNWCYQPIALIETQESGRMPKSANVTQRLAARADLAAFSVSYEPSDDGADILMFRVRQIHPDSAEVVDLKPKTYARWLWGLRRTHENEKPLCAAKTAQVEVEEPPMEATA